MSIIVAVLGAVKLVLQAFHISIPNVDENDVANGIAGFVAVVAPIWIHLTHKKQLAAARTPATTLNPK